MQNGGCKLTHKPIDYGLLFVLMLPTCCAVVASSVVRPLVPMQVSNWASSLKKKTKTKKKEEKRSKEKCPNKTIVVVKKPFLLSRNFCMSKKWVSEWVNGRFMRVRTQLGLFWRPLVVLTAKRATCSLMLLLYNVCLIPKLSLIIRSLPLSGLSKSPLIQDALHQIISRERALISNNLLLPLSRTISYLIQFGSFFVH